MIFLVFSWVMWVAVTALSFYTLRWGNVELRQQLNTDWILGLLWMAMFFEVITETNRFCNRREARQ